MFSFCWSSLLCLIRRLDLSDRVRQLLAVRSSVETALLSLHASSTALRTLTFDFARDLRLAIDYHSSNPQYWTEAGLCSSPASIQTLQTALDEACKVKKSTPLPLHAYDLLWATQFVSHSLNISSAELDLPNLPAPLDFKDLHEMAVRTIDGVTPPSATAGESSFLMSSSVFY